MGWKGTLRSMQAASRRAEKAKLKRQREYQRRQQEYAKMAALEQAKYEVEDFENHIKCLVSIHRECSEGMDWSVLQTGDLPTFPKPETTYQDPYRKAIQDIEEGIYGKAKRWVNSQPKNTLKSVTNIFILILGIFYESKLEKLGKEFKKAVRLDAEEHSFNVKSYNLIEKIVEGDVEQGYLDIILHINPFSEIEEMGSELTFETLGEKAIHATITVHDEEIIPPERKSLLKNGAVSAKKWTKSQFYELYQDHVCSVVLRIARELFALLPIDTTIVTARGDLLNTATGHKELQPILSVLIPREALQSLNFDKIDPSDSMRNFKHNMKFKKTQGFQSVSIVDRSN
jgi:hypothetical protein